MKYEWMTRASIIEIFSRPETLVWRVKKQKENSNWAKMKMKKKWAMEKFMQFLSCWTLKQANENWYTRCNLQHEFIIQISIFSFQKMHNKFYWTWLYNEEKSCKFIGMIIISLFIDFFHVIFFSISFLQKKTFISVSVSSNWISWSLRWWWRNKLIHSFYSLAKFLIWKISMIIFCVKSSELYLLKSLSFATWRWRGKWKSSRQFGELLQIFFLPNDFAFGNFIDKVSHNGAQWKSIKNKSRIELKGV